MNAYLATFEGDSPLVYKGINRRYSNSRHYPGEMMGAWGIFDVVAAPFKAVGHAVMEVGRGVATGDVSRIVSAPVKGIVHGGMETVRAVKEPAEWLYRPSKMRQWMPQAGAVITAAAPFTGPAAPFLFAGGVGLTVAGGVGQKIYTTGKQRDFIRAGGNGQPQDIAKNATNKNLWLYGGIAASVITGFIIFS